MNFQIQMPSFAPSEATKEGVWIRKFISELGVVPEVGPLDLYCDNNGAIAQAKEPRSHQKSKHILRRFHFIWEIVERWDVKLCKFTRIGTSLIRWQNLFHSRSCTQELCVLDTYMIKSSASGTLLEICPRGNHGDDCISTVFMIQ